MITMLQDFAAVQDAYPPVKAPSPPTPATNTVAQKDVQFEMLRILQEVHQAYGQGGRGLAGRGGQGGRGGRGYGNRNRNRRTPDNANFARCVTDQYYHTHGECNHISGDCTKKAPGHNGAATIGNHLRGFNAFCQPIAGE